MKTAPSLCLLAFAMVLSSQAHALYKCETKDGIVYQGRPCAAGAESLVAIVVPSFGEPLRRTPATPRPQLEAAGKQEVVAIPASVQVPLPHKN